MKRLIEKLKSLYIRNIICFFFPRKYMPMYIEHLKKLGANIEGRPDHIDRSTYFDSIDYSLFHIGNKAVISREVMLLTHDHSIANGLRSIGESDWKSREGGGGGAACFLMPIHIGEHSFIGARSSLLPGAKIGKYCIVGSNTVVKGTIPDYSIVIGNPARIVGNTKEWATKKMEQNNYIFR